MVVPAPRRSSARSEGRKPARSERRARGCVYQRVGPEFGEAIISGQGARIGPADNCDDSDAAAANAFPNG